MARGYSQAERAAITRGEFFTDAELRARPRLRRLAAKFATTPPGQAPDPNTRSMTAKRRAEIEAMVPVCGYCHEPGDDRSQLDPGGMHPECTAAWAAERVARHTRRGGTR